MRPATCQSQQHQPVTHIQCCTPKTPTFIFIHAYAHTTHTHTRGAYINIGEREREKNVYPLIYPPHTYIDLLSPFFSRISSFLFCLSWFLSSFSERYVIRNRLSVIARLTTARQSQQLETFCFFSTRLAAVALFLELFFLYVGATILRAR